MPEGHTIRRIANEWAELIGTRVAVSDPNGRFPDAHLIDGRVITETDANGKHLFVGFDHGLWLHVHLGRFGRFWWYALADLPHPPRDTVRMRMVAEDWAVDLRGPIRCRVLDAAGKQAVQDTLGPDPLRPGERPQWASEYVRQSPPSDRIAAHGAGRHRWHRQHLPGRGAVAQRDQPVPARPRHHPG